MRLPILVLTLLIPLGKIEHAWGAKIVMSSPQFSSHIWEQIVLGEGLVSRGHDVYITIASRYPKKQDIEKRGIKILEYHLPDDALYAVSEEFEMKVVRISLEPDPYKMYSMGKWSGEMYFKECGFMMSDENFLKEIRDINFDLAIIDPLPNAPCHLILPRYLGIPFISMTPFVLFWSIRMPALPSFVPFAGTLPASEENTLYTRLKNSLIYIAAEFLIPLVINLDTTLLERFAPDIRNWDDLLFRSEMFFIGFDHHFYTHFPEMPNTISVAGLSTKSGEKLPENFARIVEQSPDGVILLSFGTSASYFPEHIVLKFLEAFSKLNQTVIARFSVSDNFTVPKNTKLVSWIPQNDILAHPKTKLFITHCGIRGVYEAIYHGVPMLGFPLFGDQHWNCHRVYKKDFGLQMNVIDFTSSELFDNIQEILNNAKYRSTIQKASEIFRDQPMHPIERAVFWVEHVIRHGGKHLRTLAMDMPVYEFLMLDIIGLFIIVGFLFSVALILSLKKIWNSRRFRSILKIKSD